MDHRCHLIAATIVSLFFLSSAEGAVIRFDTVVVGNPGNLPDPLTGLGAVAYSYHITATEVTNAQYAAFLNAVDP
ncbi:MAG: formylglycine-generating enzyme family protein, partial [Nitrospira sp.]|nr:formylglycine-generating enzyme family protein [Nitrospira sp.]